MEDTTKCLMGLKLIKESEVKKLRKDLKPGKYTVDTIIRVHGELTVNEDEETTPTYSLTNKEALSLLLGFLGCTEEHASNALIQVAKMQLEGKKAPEKYQKAIEKGQLALEKGIETLPKVKRAGKVLGHLSMDEVSFVQVVDRGTLEKKSA